MGLSYRLRAGSPMKVNGTFKLHTFMAEKAQTNDVMCTKVLPTSSSMQGSGGGLYSAQYSQLPVPGGYFRGSELTSCTYVPESTGLSAGGFVDSSSVNITYNTSGVISLSYAIASADGKFHAADNVTIGSNTFTGVVLSARSQMIPGSTWATTSVNAIAAT